MNELENLTREELIAIVKFFAACLGTQEVRDAIALVLHPLYVVERPKVP